MENINVGDRVAWSEHSARGCFSSVKKSGTVLRTEGHKVWVDAGWGTLETNKEYLSPL